MELDKKRNKKWNLQYGKLVEFQQKNGHCIVPQRHEQDKSLGQWVRKQRRNYTSNTIPQGRKDLLDEIGFIWRVKADENWLQQYEKLVEFKQKSGHCIVPVKYERDKALGRWVATQRNLHTNNTLPQNRKDLLSDLGVVWKVKKLAARSITMDDVRALGIGSFQRRFRQVVFLTLSFFACA